MSQLSDYTLQVQQLVHDTAAIDFSQSDLTGFINNARNRVAMDFHCVRYLFQNASLIAGQEQYPIFGGVCGLTIANGGANYVSPVVTIGTLPTQLIFSNPATTFPVGTATNAVSAGAIPGSGVVIAISSFNSAGVTTLTDSAGNTYSKVIATSIGGGVDIEIWYNTAIANAIVAGVTTFTANSSGANYRIGQVFAVAGGLIADKTASTTNAGATTVSLSTGILTRPASLVVGALNVAAALTTYTEASGFIDPYPPQPTLIPVAYQNVSATASVTWSPSWTPSVGVAAVLATFYSNAVVGTGAAATAVTAGGVISQINMTNWGSGYALTTANPIGPGVTITDAGGGSGAVLTPMVENNVFDIQSISVLWGLQRYTMGWLPFTMFESFCRANPTLRRQPAVWTTHTEQNLLFVYPIPDQAYQIDIDAVGLPFPLVNTADNDNQVTPPVNDTVQFYAAYLALLKLQNFEQAGYYEKKYDARAGQAIRTRQTRRLMNVYRNAWRRINRW